MNLEQRITRAERKWRTLQKKESRRKVKVTYVANTPPASNLTLPSQRPAVGCQGGDALGVNKYIGKGDGRTDAADITHFASTPMVAAGANPNPFGGPPLARGLGK
jgi:hypothetical protein